MNNRIFFTVAESLETRRLFAAQALGSIPGTFGDPSGADTTVDLSSFFADSDHTFVQFTTELGSYRAQLYDAQKPQTVQNFLKYVTKGRLDDTLIHRVDVLDPSTDPTPSDQPDTFPPEILQGGGFDFPTFNQIKTSKPVVNEAQTNGVVSNTRGTLAMARAFDPNSATSEWFVNLTDNPGLDPGGFGPDGYAVFGTVLSQDMSVVDAIAALPRYNFDLRKTGDNPFTKVPLRNFTQEQVSAGVLPGAENVITTQSVAVIPDVLTYSVSSSDSTLVNPSISDGNLVLSYGSGTGSAQITVTATALDGTTASSTFTAGVGQLDVLVGGAGNAKSLSVTDSDGTVSTLSMKGAGVATVRLTGSGITQNNNKGRLSVTGTNVVVDTVAMSGTDAGTTLTISSKGGAVGGTLMGGISSDSAVRSINAKGVTITRGMTTVGAVGSVAIAGATGATIDLGGSATDGPVSLSLGTLTDSGVVIIALTKSLKLASAVSTDATPESISLNGVQSVSITGDLGQPLVATANTNIGSLSVGGDLTSDVTARQIGKVSVKGDMVNGTMTATLSASEFPDAGTANAKANQALSSLTVRGGIKGAIVRSSGSVGSITASSAAGALIVAGAPALNALPSTLADLPAPATLNVLKVSGAFSATTVAARTLGKASVGVVQTSNAGAPFGFAADTIASLTGSTAGGQKFVVKNADTQAAVDAALAGITPGDFVVRAL